MQACDELPVTRSGRADRCSPCRKFNTYSKKNRAAFMMGLIHVLDKRQQELEHPSDIVAVALQTLREAPKTPIKKYRSIVDSTVLQLARDAPAVRRSTVQGGCG
jgi:hypothetical protein